MLSKLQTKELEFSSEAAEADWYASAEGRRQTQRELELAIRNGTVVNSPGADIVRTDPELLARLMDQAKARATRAVSIRLSVADIELAREIGAKKGKGYQTVLKEAIRTGLRGAA
jgi:uncharacterized protein (DUF4415 family)